MRKITINVDTMKITNTGPLSPLEAAAAGFDLTMNAILMQAKHYGWESAAGALADVCFDMWRVFREKRDEQEGVA